MTYEAALSKWFVIAGRITDAEDSKCQRRIVIVQFQKISTLPPQKGFGISWGVEGSVRPKNSKKCMKLNCNFQRGGVVPGK